MTKAERMEYVQNNPHKTLQEIADDLGVSREMARRYCEDANAPRPFKTLSAALKEIRRLSNLVDTCQPNIVANTELTR